MKTIEEERETKRSKIIGGRRVERKIKIAENKKCERRN